MAGSKKKKKIVKKRQKPDMSGAVEYDYHLPVFLKECVDNLITKKCGIYVDGTLGGGGHAAEILSRLDSGGILLAFDKDINAIEHCKIRFEEELKKSPSKIELINDCYNGACSIIKMRGMFDGLLLDLGVSSMQLDTDSRGLSYRVDSRLDMRFGENGITAEELLNSATEEDLETILRNYGEEPQSRVIARRIIDRRRAGTLKTTFDLRAIVEEVTPKVFHFKALSRVFQAFRIAVNNELTVLENTLKCVIPLLNPGGRIVVISYHSLEDRIVKQVFKEFSYAPKVNRQAKDAIIEKAAIKLITPKPIVPNEEEIKRNPRARSAKLRIAEKN